MNVLDERAICRIRDMLLDNRPAIQTVTQEQGFDPGQFCVCQPHPAMTARRSPSGFTDRPQTSEDSALVCQWQPVYGFFVVREDWTELFPLLTVEYTIIRGGPRVK